MFGPEAIFDGPNSICTRPGGLDFMRREIKELVAFPWKGRGRAFFSF